MMWADQTAEMMHDVNLAQLVTETDRAVEEFIKKAIAERYPEHKL